MKSRFALLALLMGLSAPFAFSQETAAPDGPLIEKAGDFAKWTVTFAYPEDPSKPLTAVPKGNENPDFRPRIVITTKTKNLLRQQTTSMDGEVTDKWYAGSVQYTKPPGLPWCEAAAEFGASANEYYSKPLPAIGFAGLEWIVPAAYAGTAKYEGSNVLVFIPGGSKTLAKKDLANTALKTTLDIQPQIVLIDDQTRRPIFIKLGGITQTVKYETPPTEMQVFPADLTAAIKEGHDAASAVYQMAP